MSGKGLLRRAAILDAATAVLVEQGHGEFGLRAVATAAGLRLSHVQYYFPTLHTLLSALVVRILEDADARIRALPSAGAENLVSFLLAEQDDVAPCRLFWELWALAGRDAEANAALQDFYDGYIGRMAEAVAQDLPNCSPMECRTKAAMIVALVEGSSVLLGNGRGARLLPEGPALIKAAARGILHSS